MSSSTSRTTAARRHSGHGTSRPPSTHVASRPTSGHPSIRRQVKPREMATVCDAFSEAELQGHVASACSELGLPPTVDLALFEKAKQLLLAFEPA